MPKKTKKQVAIEKRIKTLKGQHKKLSAQKRVIQKRLNREEQTKQRKLDKLQRAADRAQAAWDKLDDSFLPSSGSSRKVTDKLVALEDQIKTQEQKLREITHPQPDPSEINEGREGSEEE